MATVEQPRRSPVRDFAGGIGLLLRGLRLYGQDPGLMALGLIPALIASLLLLAALGTLFYFIGDIADAVTWFARGWASSLRDAVEIVAGVSIAGFGVLLAVVTFTSVTLAIGDPFYEKISERVEERLGGVPGAVELPWWRELWRGVAEGTRLVILSALIGVVLFACGFLPVVGQTVVPVIGALVGGWFLAIELVGVPFTRRGFKLAERRRVLRSNRSLALGFGTATFVLFLIPLVAVVVMPGAVAGGTLLARRVLDAPR
jgi:CysZ protein